MSEEMKRILNGRFLYLLLTGCLLVNLWLIWNYREQRQMAEITTYLKENGVDYVDAQNQRQIIEAYAGAEASVTGNYRVENMVEGANLLAEALKAEDLAEIFVDNMKLTDEAAEYAKKEFILLEQVLEDNRKDNTARQFFIPDTAGFFKLFSRLLPISCTAESALLAVFLMLRCVNEPFDEGTWSVVYTTRTGRRINRLKGGAALLISLGIAALLWLLTFLAAEAVFRLAPLWGTRIGSMMVLENYFPIISRHPLTVFSYNALEFGAMLAITAIYGAMAYLFAGRVHRTVTAFARMAFACSAVAVFTSLFPRNSILYFLLQYNPVDFLLKAGHWFVSGSTFLSPRFYEAVFLALAGALLTLLVFRENRRFWNEDIR